MKGKTLSNLLPVLGLALALLLLLSSIPIPIHARTVSLSFDSIAGRGMDDGYDFDLSSGHDGMQDTIHLEDSWVITSAPGDTHTSAALPEVTDTLNAGAAAAVLPASVSTDWWATVQADIRQSEYHVTWQEQSYLSDLPAAYQAPNRAQNLRTYFTPTGIRVTPHMTTAAFAWEWGLVLTGYGYAGHLQPLTSAELVATGNRIEYRREDLTEWYVNDERGLEQGFTVTASPEGAYRDAPLQIDLALSGDLTPILYDDGQAIEFTTPDGVRVLRYSDLYACDARGRSLPTQMSLVPLSTTPYTIHNTQYALCLIVDTTSAVFPITIDPLATSPNWTAESDQTGAEFGYSVSTAGDVNGDGYDDVIIGANRYDNGQTDEGAVFVYHGSAAGLSTTAAWMAEGNQAHAQFGFSVGTAGDVNGDGYADVIIGAWVYDGDQTSEGRAFVYHGSASSLSTTANWTAESDQTGAYFGYSVSTAGDVNGDGYDDVIVGAMSYDSGQTDEGMAFVYQGSASGLSAKADWAAEGNQSQAHFGHSVGTAGDVDGDGYDDVIVGAMSYDSGQTDEGMAFVYHGSASGLSMTADWKAESDQGRALFGFSVGTAGDVNGDGYDDVIVGAHQYSNGQYWEGGAFVYHGSDSGLSTTADWTAESNQADAQFGVSVSTAGDVDGDGYDDVIVGAYVYSNGQHWEGEAFVYYGSAAGLSTTAGWTAESDQAEALFGESVSTAGDVNGDGYDDVIVGAHYYDAPQRNEGRAFVYHGLPPSDIEVTPTSFEVTLAPREMSTQTMTISNGGTATLTFDITVAGTAPVGWQPTMVFGAAPTGQQPIRFPAEKVEPGLRQDILASPSGQGTFLVYLKEQADLSKAYSISDWVERGQYVYETLWNTARQSQAGLVSYLVNQVQLNAASGYRSHYIVNAMLVTANVDTLDALAARPDIAYIEAVKKYSVPKPIPGVANGETETAIEWGVAKIRADQVWTDFGVRGEGIVVANIDTGVLNSHPALVNQYRGTTTGSHDYNWFDATGAYPTAPGDDNGHGTHTMGTMIGSEGGIYQVGVAPAARWIAAKAFERDGWGSSSDLLAAAEWVLAPYPIAGSPADADPSRRPHVVNSSWGGHGGDPWFQASVAAWRAAGIFPVFAAGNSGPNPGTIDSPADYAESFASGATDSSDTIASSSGRGPSSLTSEIKPDLSTPGVDVNSAWNDGGYATFSGTSMASPHAAGCAALILSAAPSLSLEAIENVMTSTAIDLGTRGPDYDYGYGRVDCYAAVAKAVVLWLSVTPTSGTVPPSGNQDITVVFDADGLAIGTYTASIVISNNDPNENPVTVPVTMTVTRPATWGKLEGAVTGLGYCDANPAPLANADVLIEDSTGMTWTLTTDISGTYQIWLDEAHSPLTLTVTYPDYETGQATGITITGQGTTTREFDLRWLQPCLSVSPTDVNVTLALSGTATQTLTILNIGALMSDFALFERNGGFVIAQHQTEDQLHIGGQVHTVNESKEASPDTIGQGPVPLASGGPDPFGYTYKDSHEVDGPIYQWIEIAPPAGGTGTKLHGLTGEDDAYFWPLSLPFTFTFYETDYMELAVASNGTLYFEDQHLGYRNVPIPGSNRYGVDRFIAHLWDDLVINPGAVYYQAFDSMFIIEYYQASGYGSPGYASWEVILFENGNILFQYQDVTFGNFRDYGGDATVGIQGDPTTGLQYSYNTAALSDGLAICFAHPGQSPDCSLDVPWLSVNPTTGTVLPSGTQAIDAIFDASVPEVMQLGEYYATLVIQSNDPGTPQFQIPVTMTVAVPSYNVFLPLISK